MENKLNLISASNKDIVEIKNHIFAILKSYGLEPDETEADTDLNDIEASYLNRGGIFDIIRNDENKIVATVGLYPHSKETCELRKMYLAKSERGKGYGKLLLEHSIKRGKELGFKKITLETASVLKEAIALYLKYGFKPYDGENCARCDQSYYLDI